MIVHVSCLKPAGTTAEGKLLQCDQYKVLQYAVPNAKTEEKHEKAPSTDHDWGPDKVASGFQADHNTSQ